jgi:hypothetical protein|tara:strand:+ start:347 stop:484 length:138 start_codon:yes stop_codon:yes gene_type:complete
MRGECATTRRPASAADAAERTRVRFQSMDRARSRLASITAGVVAV